MNVAMLSRFRCFSVREASRFMMAPKTVSRLANRPGFVCLGQPDRGAKTVHIEWKRPEKVPSVHPKSSGDLEPLPKLDPDGIFHEFQNCELNEMTPEQRKLYSLKFLPHVYTYRSIMQQTISEVQRHTLDCDSVEAQIAKMTVTIRRLQDLWMQRPGDKRQKVILKQMIEKRKSYLNKLRATDYKRFEWLLEKLNLEYRPKPEDNGTVTRKGSLRKLTEEYCEQVKTEKLTEFKKKLQIEREKFEEEKKQLLEYIAKEEEVCGKLRQANQQ